MPRSIHVDINIQIGYILLRFRTKSARYGPKACAFPGSSGGGGLGLVGGLFARAGCPIGQAESRRQTVSCAVAKDSFLAAHRFHVGSHRKRKLEGPSALGGMRLSTQSSASPPHASGFDRTVPGPPPARLSGARLPVCFQEQEGCGRKSNRGPASVLLPSLFTSFPRTWEIPPARRLHEEAQPDADRLHIRMEIIPRAAPKLSR